MHFYYILKLIDQNQRKDPSLTAKYTTGTYQKYSFRGEININLNLVLCEDKIVIPSIIQSCVLHWYHTYLINTVMDRTEAMIHHHWYLTVIRKSVRKEINICDTYQRTKWPNIKYGK